MAGCGKHDGTYALIPLPLDPRPESSCDIHHTAYTANTSGPEQINLVDSILARYDAVPTDRIPGLFQRPTEDGICAWDGIVNELYDAFDFWHASKDQKTLCRQTRMKLKTDLQSRNEKYHVSYKRSAAKGYIDRRREKRAEKMERGEALSSSRSWTVTELARDINVVGWS